MAYPIAGQFRKLVWPIGKEIGRLRKGVTNRTADNCTVYQPIRRQIVGELISIVKVVGLINRLVNVVKGPCEQLQTFINMFLTKFLAIF